VLTCWFVVLALVVLSWPRRLGWVAQGGGRAPLPATTPVLGGYSAVVIRLTACAALRPLPPAGAGSRSAPDCHRLRRALADGCEGFGRVCTASSSSAWHAGSLRLIGPGPGAGRATHFLPVGNGRAGFFPGFAWAPGGAYQHPAGAAPLRFDSALS